VIDTENLTKRFGSLTAVDSVTIHVNEGEVFGFLGPNGAGKTTTVRLLCCLISKTSGVARVAGYEVSRAADSLKIRKIIGLVPDNVGLYEELSAYKNLDYYGRLYDCPVNQRRENIQRFLTMLGLWEKRDSSAGSFSKGMKQKLAIARALIHDPQILFMDEPTANLDPESAKTVRDFILELRKERRTIFLNTHNLDEAQRICDKIAILNTRLMASGTPTELGRAVGGKKTVIELQALSGAVLAALNNLPVGHMTVDGNKLTIDVSDPEKENVAITDAIFRAGGHIRSVDVVGSTLEDAYLKLVREEKS
jgi:ABC-2 type transport system ATP-binding protein